GSLVGVCYPADDRQTESGPAVVLRAAVEAFEDALAVFGCDAVAVVLDDDGTRAPVARRCNRHAAVRVANRILQQVAREFAQPSLVAVDDRALRCAVDANVARVSSGGDVARASAHDVA